MVVSISFHDICKDQVGYNLTRTGFYLYQTTILQDLSIISLLCHPLR
jgi:hypothetical protein